MKISKKELCQIIDESISLAINDFALREGLVTRNTVNKRALNQLNESFMDNFKDLRNQLAGLFKKNNKVKTAIQNAINFINQAKDQLEGEAQKDIESIGNVLSSLAQPILGQPQYESLQTMLSQKNVSKKDLKKAIDNAINEASHMNNIDLNESMKRLNEGIGDKFRNLLNAINKKPGVKDLLLKAKQSIESILNMLTGQAQQDMKAIVQVLGAAAGQFNQQGAQQQQTSQQQPAQSQPNQMVKESYKKGRNQKKLNESFKNAGYTTECYGLDFLDDFTKNFFKYIKTKKISEDEIYCYEDDYKIKINLPNRDDITISLYDNDAEDEMYANVYCNFSSERYEYEFEKDLVDDNNIKEFMLSIKDDILTSKKYNKF